MKYRHFIALVSMATGSLAAFGPKAEDPFVGQYSLNTGGGDAMSGVHLLLLPGGDYAIAYFGGMQQGTWKALPSGELELKEWPADPADFVVYGSHNPALGREVQLNFRGFEESLAKIGLKPASQGVLPMHPAFSPKANGYASSYGIKRPATELPTLYLAAYQDESIAPEYRVPVTKESLYAFPIGQQYNDYVVLYNKAASIPAARYVGRFNQQKLTLYPVRGGRVATERPDSYGERRAIGDTDLKEIPEYLKSARQTIPDKTTFAAEEGKPTLYYRIKGTERPLKASEIKLLPPLFKTSYD